MNCRDDQTDSSRTKSRSVQFQSSLKSVGLKSSTASDRMEDKVKIDQPGQRHFSKCGENISEESCDSVAVLREDVSAMKTIISDQNKRNSILEDVVISLCEQMTYVIEQLPTSSAEHVMTMKASLSNSIAKLSDDGRMKLAADQMSEPTTHESAKEITNEKADTIESLSNSNFTLTDVVTNCNIQSDQLRDKMINGESNVENGQDECDVTQQEILEVDRVETVEGPSNGNVKKANNNEPLVYHLSEKHGSSGSKTLRINIAGSNEQKQPKVGKLTKSAFSSSFSNLPNSTSTSVKKKSKPKYERTNSLQQISSTVSLDDMEWPDTDKILEELEVIKEKSISNIALASGERKLSVEESKSLDESDWSYQPTLSDCPAGSGHCGTDTDSKSQKSPQLENNELHRGLRKDSGVVNASDISASQEASSTVKSNDITKNICDGPHGCDTVSDVVEKKCTEMSTSKVVTNDLDCGSGSMHSLSETGNDVPQSNSISVASSQKAGKSSSKKRRKKKLSESENSCKPGEETKDLVSKDQSMENKLCGSPSKPETTPSNPETTSSNPETSPCKPETAPAKPEPTSKTDVPIITPRRKAKNKHSASNASTTNIGVNPTKGVNSETDKSDACITSNSRTNEISNTTHTATDKQSCSAEMSASLSSMVKAKNQSSSVENVANPSPLKEDVISNNSLVANVDIDPTSWACELNMETSVKEFVSQASPAPEISSGPSATDVDVVEAVSSTTDVTTDHIVTGPSLTEVACAPSESRVEEDAKCSKASVGDTCQPSSSGESLGLDQHMSGPSHFSPEAKEFEPTREYGKAKLLLSPEVSKDAAKNKTRCPKLTSTCMEQDKYCPPSEEKQGSCAECKASTSQRCSNCRQVFYCKRDCQREHWKKGHKTDCKPFKVETNSTLGRYLVATRDFKAGDIIFKDEPLFVGPKQITEPICLGCYKRVDGSYRCSKCTWPMCGPACESSPDHQPECVVGKVMGSPIEIQDFNDTNHFYEVVSPLRGLALKKRAPKKYEDLLALESHYNDRVGTNVYNENQKRVVNMLKNYFMLVDFPTEDIDASDRPIHLMTGIIDVNSVDIPMEETEIVGIYPTYSMLEHSCTPNTKYKVSPLHQLTLRAAVNIRQGEHLSTIYTHMLWGTAARRDCLKSTRYFMCTCRRCADPTELGTNFSALRCPKCPLGFMMSAAPLDQLADWICTSCNSTMTGDEANEITLQLGEEVEMVLAQPRVKDLENFIEKSSSTVVHPNHFHLFAARHSLLQMLGRENAGLDEEAVKKKEKLCQEFLKTCTALDPGMCKLSSYAGVALYEYHLAVMARTRQGPTDQQVDKIALKKDLDTAKALLQQCIKVLQEEPSEKPEGQLRHLAEQNLQELSQWESP